MSRSHREELAPLERRRSAESAARTLQLAALCGGAITPAIRSAARPLPLSPREREIAAMIAEGLSSSEIANKIVGFAAHCGRPHLPRRIKLDVSDRDDLAAIVSATLQSAG
jgi:ATP/maltotriose-dependent transcriptional regulator MalT